MNWSEIIGYVAGGVVFAVFCAVCAYGVMFR